jgi:hypothetical protein
MLEFVPLRTLAAVGIAIDFCPLGHQESTVQAAIGHEHKAHHHGQAPEPRSDGPATSDVSVEHCTSGFFAPSAHRVPLIPAYSGGCIVSGERLHVAFVADILGRPPLAL